MFCAIKSKNLVARKSRLTHEDNENNFQILLNENNEISKHQRNPKFLMTEIYKIKNNHALQIMHHLFQFRKTLSIFFREIVIHGKKTTNYELETRALFLSAKFLSEHKNSTSLNEFKSKQIMVVKGMWNLPLQVMQSLPAKYRIRLIW